MDSKANTLLESLILGDSQTVSYRQLSRALTVHVNEAKHLLYTFYTNVNASSSGRVRATYMVTGLLANGNTKCVLVSEIKLKEVKASFDRLLAVHIYSLEPNQDTKNDLTLITNSAAAVRKLDSTKTPAELCRNYGIISYSPLINNHDIGALQSQRSAARASPVVTAEIKQLPKSTNSMFPSKLTSSTLGSTPKSVSPSTSGSNTPEPSSVPTAKPKKMSLAASFAAARARAANPEPKEQVIVAHNNDCDDDDHIMGDTISETGQPSLSFQARRQQEEDLKKALFDEDAEEEFYQQQLQKDRTTVSEAVVDDDVMDIDVASNKIQVTFSDQEEEEAATDDGSDLMANGLFVKEDPALFEDEEVREPNDNQPMKKITKRVTQTDAQGYLVTKMVDEWVPCTAEEAEATRNSELPKNKLSLLSSSSSSSATVSTTSATKSAALKNPIKPLSKPKASKSTKSTSKAKQTSLTAFFK